MTPSAAWDLLRAESPIWAIDAARLDGIAASIAAERPRAAAPARAGGQAGSDGGTAVIPIFGPLTHRASFLSEILGSGTYSGIGVQIARAVGDGRVDRIVLWIDSPGGSVAGLPELADQVARANRIKPVVALADTFAASAAFWIATQAGTLIAAPSAQVGSLGVVALHSDLSRALDKAGIAPTFIVSRISPFKTEGNAYQPLGAEAKAYQQAQVDKIATRFVRAVSIGRAVDAGTVTKQFGQGRLLFADDARKAGMVDAIGDLQLALSSPDVRSARRQGRAVVTDPRSPPQSRRARLASLAADPASPAKSPDRAARLALLRRDPDDAGAARRRRERLATLRPG